MTMQPLPTWRQDKRFKWLVLGGVALVIRIIFGFFPELCEFVYSRGLFLLFRLLIDFTIGWSPFPSSYILLPILVAWFFFTIFKIFKYWKYHTWKSRFYSLTYSAFSFIGMTLFLFLTMWGFNYARVPFEEHTKLDARGLEIEELRAEAIWIKAQVIHIREQIPNIDTNEITTAYYPEDLETEMRRCLTDVLTVLEYPSWGYVRGRYIYPEGTLLQLGISGIYNPFTGEGNVDAALHITQKPFTLAHELAHGYGFGDEAVCNFLGYLACVHSRNKAIQYSGYLTYWRYVFGELSDIDEEMYDKERPTISIGMKKDLKGIYAVREKFPDLFPGVQEAVNNTYLKMQGVQEGVKSYDRMVTLVSAWRRKGH